MRSFSRKSQPHRLNNEDEDEQVHPPAPTDEDDDNHQEDVCPVMPANPPSQRRSVTAPSTIRPRTITAKRVPEMPTPSTRTRGNGLLSIKCKNYASSCNEVPQDVIIKLRSATDPDYIETERIEPANTVCETIIAETWGGDATKTVTWFDEHKKVNNGTQRAALVAQAGGEIAPQPCTHCINNGGAFDTCKVNAVWPANGACASCGYWGHAKKHCNLVHDKNPSPRKSAKLAVDSAINNLEHDLSDQEATLLGLQEDLMKSKLINWNEVKNNPAGVKRDCEKVLEYLDIHAKVLADLAETSDRLNTIIRRRRVLRRALSANPFANKPLTEDELSEEEFERGMRELDQKHSRQKTRNENERDNDESPLKHKKRTIVRGIDDDESDDE
ncbi:hypothetical protein KEM55_003326 [Ascosphaera atra]|nr:hypothetical protein KEM55_003326 [Ascosphaera atra]